MEVSALHQLVAAGDLQAAADAVRAALGQQ